MKSYLLSLSAAVIMISAACKSTEKTSELAGKGDSGPVFGCRVAPYCKQELPKLPKATGFKTAHNRMIPKTGNVLHRGRDVIALQGAPIWVQAKFAYGMFDADLKGENVDIYLAAACQPTWKKIASVTTTKDGEHAAVDGVEDSGGRVYADISSAKLPVGKYRVLLVATGDNSSTELSIDILSKNTKVVVSDIDGTLTESEMAAATEVIGIQPKAHPSAAEMLTTLYDKGYHIFYLTARPEWLGPNTRDWLTAKSFPPGSIHTTMSKVGAQGDAASNYKIAEIKAFTANTGIVPSFAFGNKPSDVKAFGMVGIAPKSSFYFKMSGDTGGGNLVNDYGNLIPGIERMANVCGR